MQIIKQAAEAAKSLDPKKVAEAMHSGKPFKTVIGDIAFDKKGDISGYVVDGKNKDRYVLYTWKKGADGKITYVENRSNRQRHTTASSARRATARRSNPVTRWHGIARARAAMTLRNAVTRSCPAPGTIRAASSSPR